MDGEVIDLAAMERRLRAARDRRAGKSEYEHLVEGAPVVRMPINPVSMAHPSVWAQRQKEREETKSEAAAWRDVVDVLTELRVQMEAHRKERLEFEAWARYERAAIERERRVLQAEARTLAEDFRRRTTGD